MAGPSCDKCGSHPGALSELAECAKELIATEKKARDLEEQRDKYREQAIDLMQQLMRGVLTSDRERKLRENIGELEKQLKAARSQAKESDSDDWEVAYARAVRAVKHAQKIVDDIAGWSGSSGNWPLQEASGILAQVVDLFDRKSRI